MTKIFDNISDEIFFQVYQEVETNRHAVEINYSLKGFGFGQIILIQNPDGTIEMDNEYISDDRTRQILNLLINRAKTK